MNMHSVRGLAELCGWPD